MKMRTFIGVRTPSKAITTAHHARYISERERDPDREEPQSRPIFTHDRDGLKHTATDRYLAGGDRPRARTCDIQHLIIAFNSHDARELEKLSSTRTRRAPQPSKVDGEQPEAEAPLKVDGGDDPKEAQLKRDRPFAEAIRKMMSNLEERTDLSELRYALAVHRHTDKTHVHVLLRREYTSRETGERRMLHRLPVEFLNGRDERGKARGGILDSALSDALDTMIPRRVRPSRAPADSGASGSQPTSTDERPHHQLLMDEPGTHPEGRNTPSAGPAQKRESAQRPAIRFINPRAAGQQHTVSHPPALAAQASSTERPAGDARPRLASPPDTAPPATSHRPSEPPDNHQKLMVNHQEFHQGLMVTRPENPSAGAPDGGLRKNISSEKKEIDSPAGRATESATSASLTKAHLTNTPPDPARQQDRKKTSSYRGR